ncbi:RNA polymerase sigma-70 factor [Aquimarina addita]|uniref:RNA polymerase sigma factor n=1 Tax=Aquimarina addita TaxID=870485 RepID=UPI0031ECF50D
MSENYAKKDMQHENWTGFKAMFNQHYSWLCSYIYKISKDESLAQDIVQIVFINLWEKRKTITINSSTKNYLLRSCHNQYLKHLRSINSQCTRLDTLKLETLCELYEEEETAWKEQKIKDINVAIEALPPKCKQVFILHKFEHIKYKEIAEIMGISIKTVENHIGKALLHLRKSISYP